MIQDHDHNNQKYRHMYDAPITSLRVAEKTDWKLKAPHKVPQRKLLPYLNHHVGKKADLLFSKGINNREEEGLCLLLFGRC